VKWSLEYEGKFPTFGLVAEVSLRKALRPPRRVPLRQLLTGTIVAPYRDAFCWALDVDEVRAEKVRAAFTRAEIRDFFDLALLKRSGADFTSPEFVSLVDAKLAELKSPSLAEQPKWSGKTEEIRRQLAGP
jgi:hypothetical protein